MSRASRSPDPAPSGPSPADGVPRIVAKKPAKKQFASTMLVLEAFVVLFATLTASRLLTDVPTGDVWLVGGVLAVTLLLLSRLVSIPGGYVAGSAVQIPFLACGIVIPLMIPVALVFIALWVVSLWLGAKIDRERAEYDAAHPEQAPNVR